MRLADGTIGVPGPRRSPDEGLAELVARSGGRRRRHGAGPAYWPTCPDADRVAFAGHSSARGHGPAGALRPCGPGSSRHVAQASRSPDLGVDVIGPVTTIVVDRHVDDGVAVAPGQQLVPPWRRMAALALAHGGDHRPLRLIDLALRLFGDVHRQPACRRRSACTLRPVATRPPAAPVAAPRHEPRHVASSSPCPPALGRRQRRPLDDPSSGGPAGDVAARRCRWRGHRLDHGAAQRGAGDAARPFDVASLIASAEPSTRSKRSRSSRASSTVCAARRAGAGSRPAGRPRSRCTSCSAGRVEHPHQHDAQGGEARWCTARWPPRRTASWPGGHRGPRRPSGVARRSQLSAQVGHALGRSPVRPWERRFVVRRRRRPRGGTAGAPSRGGRHEGSRIRHPVPERRAPLVVGVPQRHRHLARSHALRTSSRAFQMPSAARLLLGAVARWTTAWARFSWASGRPTNSTAWAAASATSEAHSDRPAPRPRWPG